MCRMKLMALKNSKKIEFMLIIVVFLVAGLGIANASDSKTEPVKKNCQKKNYQQTTI